MIKAYTQSLAVPAATFRSPVDFDYKLSGGFNELRETHFHAGIDIKPSTGAKNDKIYSIAAGHISRIKVSAGGYGYALYIEHPEIGYTSVYGHLAAFSSKVDKIVKSYQTKNESFEIDIPLSPDILPVVQGEVIGIMGNTGFSFGDHLHFEVRDTKTERPINPYLFGFTVMDKIKPTVLNLAIHGLDENFHKLCDIRIPQPNVLDAKVSIPEIIKIPASRAGFAIQTYDRADGSHNKMGIYSLRVYSNDSLIYSFHMDKMSFDQSRQITGFVDYSEKKRSGKTYMLCYKLPGLDLDMLKKNGPAVIKLIPDEVTQIRIEAEDFFRNRKSILFSITRSTTFEERSDTIPYKQWIKLGQNTDVHDVNIKVSFSAYSLYRSIPFTLSGIQSENDNTSYRIHNKYEALKSSIGLMIKPEIKAPKLKDKAIIALISDNGKKYNYGGSWNDGYLYCRINEFGTYKVEYDTIAPMIKTINFNEKTRNKTNFKFYLSDNYPVKGRDARDIYYRVRINGQFVISPFNQKTSVLEIPLTVLSAGNHDLEIMVKDHSGNTRIFKKSFTKN